MAFANVTPLAKSLSQLGLRFVLTEQDVDPNLYMERLYGFQFTRSDQVGQSRPNQVTKTYQRPPRPSYNREQSSERRPVPRTEPRYVSTSRPESKPSSQIEVNPALSASKKTVTITPKFNVNSWPQPWQDLLKRTQIGTIVWTYYELGLDLCGYPDSVRRSVLGKIIAHLSMPKGSNTFWPLGLPVVTDEQKTFIEPNPDLFWSGVKQLQGKVIVVLGQDAADILGLSGKISRRLYREEFPFMIISGMKDFINSDSRLVQELNLVKMCLRQMNLF